MKYRQMAWLETHSTATNKVLHLKADDGNWHPYSAFSHLRKPDSTLPGASKGYATMQHLLKAGWQLVPSEEASKVMVI
jgi:hypothetical protein